jgi:lysophospholipase L1-like esterase
MAPKPNSARLAACLAAVARQHGCEFLDISEVISASDIDGIHLDADAHRTLGMAVADQIQSMRG